MTDLDVAVVGAGISGLAAAHLLQREGRSVQVFEAAERVGGRMACTRLDGYLIDEGAETIAARGYQATWRLIREVGLPTAGILPIGGAIAVWRGGRAHAHLGHPRGLLTGAGMSWRGRLDWLRFTAELMARRREFDPDRPESTPLGARTVSEHGRRYHPDLHDYLLQPLAGHGFGYHPERSALAPIVASMLSVGGVGAQWLTYDTGMDTLARALAQRVPVQLGRAVTAVRTDRTAPGGGAARLHFADGSELTARQLLLSVPAPLALALHEEAPPQERPFLAACSFTPMLKVACLLDRPLPGPTRSPSYALSVPACESKVLAGLILDHVKASGRAPQGRGLVSLFASPWASPALLDAPDEAVAATVTAEAERYLPGLSAATLRTVVLRFRHGLPEATPAALRLRADFARRPLSRIEYAGDWTLLRPSSEGAIRSAELAAHRICASRRSAHRAPAGAARATAPGTPAGG